MKSTCATAFLSALLFLIPACIAGDTQTQENCVTLKSTKSVKSISTATKTQTVTFERLQIVNYTPVKTVTLPAATSTTTIVTTHTLTSTLPTGTSTFDITSTILETDTSTEPTQTSTFISTFTSTVTTTSGTSTIAAPSGFIPAESSLPRAGGPLKRSLIRGAANARNIFGRDYTLWRPGKGIPTFYPTEVICSKLVEVYKIFTQTYTAKKTTTVTAKQSTSTISSTSTITSTSVVNPVSASLFSTILSTSTISTTLYPSTTVTLSVTLTVTNVIPVATFYAACDTDNIVYSVNGNNAFVNLSPFPDVVQFGEFGSISPYDCCVSCQQNLICSATVFSEGQCGVFTAPSASLCTAPNEYLFVPIFTSSQAAGPTDFAPNALSFSNGVCGEYIS